MVELPPLQPLIIEARRYQVTCPRCAHHQHADYPPGLGPQRTFSARIEALVCYLHHVQHVSYERLQKLMGQVFGLSISQGAIANIIRRAARKLQPQAERIGVTIRASPVIGCDETSARVGGHNQWQWVFETQQASYHLIVPTRGSQVIEQTLGEAEPQVWVSDCFSAQLKAPAKQRQLCLAHQLRNLQYGSDAERCAFCYRMQQLLRRALGLSKHRDRLSPRIFAEQVKAIEAACDQLLGEPVSTHTGQRLRKRYRKHRDALFTFLRRPDVPADNNGSERALRLGFVGGTDTHVGLAGEHRSALGALDPEEVVIGGFTAVLAEALTRESLWEALQARRCYATLASHILLSVKLNGHWMGSELTEAQVGYEVELGMWSIVGPQAHALLLNTARTLIKTLF